MSRIYPLVFTKSLFFVISGYLISGLILRALIRSDFKTFDFYARRTKRIFPAVVVLLASVFAVGWLTLFADQYKQLGQDAMEGALFVNNLSQHFSDGYIHDVEWPGISLGHLWSLGVEEQFYLVWPLFLLTTWRFGKWQIVLLATVTLISFGANIWIAARGNLAAYFVPWTRFWQLSLGGLLAYVEVKSVGILPRKYFTHSENDSHRLIAFRNLCGGAGLALIVVSCVGLRLLSRYPGWYALTPTIGAFLTIAAGPQGWINRHILGTPSLVAIGLISYPLYLWHQPCLHLSRLLWRQPGPIITAGAVIVAFLLAFLTYKYIEIPIRSSRRNGPLVGVICMAMLACGGFGYLVATQRISARPLSSNVDRFAAAKTEDWLNDTYGTSWTISTGSFLTLGHGQRIVLYIGDSNMQQYYPRIARILAGHPENRHSAVFAARDWCAPTEIDVPSSRATSSACRSFMRAAFQYAKNDNVDTVVISACWRCYFASLENLLARSGQINPGTDQALDALRAVVGNLVHAGKHVYIVLGIPVGADFDPRYMIDRTIRWPGFRVVATSPRRSEVASAVDPIVSRLRIVAQSTGATIIDPMQSLCNQTTCFAVSRSGDPMYHDWFNLRPSFVRESVRFLDETILDPDTGLAPPRSIDREEYGPQSLLPSDAYLVPSGRPF